jgi:glycerol kinase
MTRYLLAVDQGTTSSRAILFRPDLSVAGVAQQEFAQHYPAPGRVEHDPEDIWGTTLAAMRGALAQGGATARDVAAIGLANQRETTLVWERATGRPIHNAIVWQDRRSAAICARLKAEGAEPKVAARTGLLLDPYFSATKIAWILDHVPGARARAEAGELAFGTVDSFLLWRLTGGAVHATDATNASRTALYDIHAGRWDEDLCRLFRVPMALLPDVRDCVADFGATTPDILGAPVAIRGVAGDQQAAAIGQACFAPGMMKATYGTGGFALLNTGATAVASKSRLLTTVAWRLDGKPTYALEGAIFIAGAAVQWLRDGLGLIARADETDALAEAADPAQAVYLVPAFTGLGAPWWDAEARGALFGLTRATTRAELARAALECVGYQTADLLDAMRGDWGAGAETVLRVDGGMTASGWTMQFLADILDAPADRPVNRETTAAGAAWLAGRADGLTPPADVFTRDWALDRRFAPRMDGIERASKLAGWRDAVRRTRSSEKRTPERDAPASS